jgi:hypothetical protein
MTGIIDWTNAQTVPVDVFATWWEISVLDSGSEEQKIASIYFPDLFLEEPKWLEGTAELEPTSLKISVLLDSSVLKAIFMGMKAANTVYNTPRAVLVLAGLVLKALYGDGVTLENYKLVLRE